MNFKQQQQLIEIRFFQTFFMIFKTISFARLKQQLQTYL